MESFKANHSDITMKIQNLEKKTDFLSTQIQDFCLGNISLTVNGQFVRHSHIQDAISSIEPLNEHSQAQESQAQEELVERSIQHVPNNSSCWTRFELNKNLSTLHEVWREWTNGINGLPSLKHMEENYPQWRKGKNTIAKAVSRRKILINAVKERIFASKNATDEEAVDLLEQKRKAENLSLDGFQKELKKRKLI